MTDESTRSVMRALARGIDPTTGEALPNNHLCQQPPIVRALAAAVAEIDGTHARRSSTPTAKAGTPWAPDDDEALARAFDRGDPVGKLAQEFQRSRNAITARLVRLGKLEAPPGIRLRAVAAPARASLD